MNKTEIAFIRDRIDRIVKCTNGNISTVINKKRKGTGLTDAKKLQLIRDGWATLKDDTFLAGNKSKYDTSVLQELLRAYDYPVTDIQKEKIAFNSALERKEQDLHTEVELEGARLLDKVVLGLLQNKDIPDELHKLGEMVQLAR